VAGEGFRSVAAWMASRTGTPVGTAVSTLEMVGLLADLPVLAEVFRACGRPAGSARWRPAVAAQ
jgi:hypothetical protein